jgi:hypothetical protein
MSNTTLVEEDFLWSFSFVRNNKVYVRAGHHVKDLVFCPIVIKFGCYLQV